MNVFDSEFIVLGHVLANLGNCSEVTAQLKPGYFSAENYTLYSEMLRHKTAQGVYQAAIDGQIEGWPVTRISDLLDLPPAGFQLSQAMRSLTERFIRRNSYTLANRIATAARSGADVDDLKLLAQDIVLATEGVQKRGLTHIGEIVEQVVADLKTGHKRYIRSGFEGLDSMITGFFNQDLVILAARPSMGKTALAGNLALRIASQGYPVGFFSLEMSQRAIVGRLLACSSRMGAEKIRSGNVYDPEFAEISKGADKISRLPIYFDDHGGLKLTQLHGMAKEWKRKHQGRIIFVDYLQLMKGEGKSSYEIVTSISRGLKEIAKDLDVPVIALSQLNRNLESRTDRRPQLSDLRDSGAIEQDADTVIFLHREEYYTENRKDGPTEVIVAKQRSGPTGSTIIDFDGKIQRFN